GVVQLEPSADLHRGPVSIQPGHDLGAQPRIGIQSALPDPGAVSDSLVVGDTSVVMVLLPDPGLMSPDLSRDRRGTHPELRSDPPHRQRLGKRPGGMNERPILQGQPAIRHPRINDRRGLYLADSNPTLGPDQYLHAS